tara:strand:- start:1831 stop:2553 length:723 start_codon:yes stop_codon:yes gene_type:complete
MSDAPHLWLCRRNAVSTSSAFCRAVLSRYAPVRPDEWRFAAGRHGKPCLADLSVELEFNLSHSGEWLIFAISRAAALGVDIEHTGKARDVMRLARRFFSGTETADLEALPEARRRQRFYDYWTLKEATVKASGGALAPALGGLAFELSYPPGGGTGSVRPLGDAPKAGVRYYLAEPVRGYRLALCWFATCAAPKLPRLFVPGPRGRVAARPLGLRAMSRPWGMLSGPGYGERVCRQTDCA